MSRPETAGPMPGRVLFLSQQETLAAGAGDMYLAMQAVEKALVARHWGDAVLPSKVVLRWGDVSTESTVGRINAMPAYVGEPYRMAGLKWIGSKPANLGRGLPRAGGLIVLSDPETMFPVAVMDASVISAMRTGAVSGLAARHLAPPESRRLVVVGAGVQGRTQALAVVAGVPTIETVLFYDVDPGRARACARAVERAVNRPCRVIDELREAVRQADVVVTATTAARPVVDARMLGTAGWLVIQIAGYDVEMDVLQRSAKIVVDDWDEVIHRGISTVARAAQLGLITRQALHAQLGAILAGEKGGRERPNEGIFFNAIGLAVEDVALATEILLRARRLGIGRELALFEPEDWFARVNPLTL